MLLKNGIWVHQTEYEALRRLVKTCQTAIDAKTPSSADWQAVREAVYDVLNAWIDVEDADRAIRDLMALKESLEAGGSSDTPAGPR